MADRMVVEKYQGVLASDGDTRPGWDAYFLLIAGVVAFRADCRRRQVGSVIVKDNRIVATGYNGAPAGEPGCFDGFCPRGLLSVEECPSFIDGNNDYSNCIGLHAEQNSIVYADRSNTQGATMYLTLEPCDSCLKLIKAAGISRIVTL